MNNIVGKYKGTPVYKVTLPEYVNGRLYKDEDNIYLLGGELVYKNETFARLDGNYVTEYDPHKREVFYTVPKFGAGTDPIPAITIKDRGVEFTSSIGTVEGDTDSKSETKTEDAVASSEFKPEDVEATLAGVFDTDYFSSMTDIDAFLKSNS
jgi:hypothetical protein